MLKKRYHFALILILMTGLALFSGCRRDSHSYKAAFMVDYISETLDLSEGQEEHLNQIKDELMEKGRQMHADRETMHAEMVSQLRSEEIDQARVKALIAQHRAQMDELVDLMVVRVAEFHRTLTPEQREKLVAKLEELKKWHHPRWD